MDQTDEEKRAGRSKRIVPDGYAEVTDELTRLTRSFEELVTETDEHAAIAIALAARDPSTVKESSLEALQITVALQHVAMAILNARNLLLGSKASTKLAEIHHKEHGRAPFQTYNQARAELMEVIQRPFTPVNEEWANMPMLEGFKVRRKQTP